MNFDEFEERQPSLLSGLMDPSVVDEPVNPREEVAPLAPPVSPWRNVPPWSVPPRQNICGTCSMKGYIRAVVVNQDGSFTGLCPTHTAMERELRSALRNGLQPMTAERAKEIRKAVHERFRRPSAA